MGEIFVYIYRDPKTGVVKYVGSGSKSRMDSHTTPKSRQVHNTPFQKWINSQVIDDWNLYREFVAGPFDNSVEARVVEQQWIDDNLNTVLNVNRADNCYPLSGEWVKPRSSNGGGSCRKFVVTKTRLRFESIQEAADYFGTTKGKIKYQCKIGHMKTYYPWEEEPSFKCAKCERICAWFFKDQLCALCAKDLVHQMEVFVVASTIPKN